MRLKKIRLAGFKSFVDPTNIPFPGDMTAVVGPNGCGKSNVIDAVRWVLGESSAKNLRGDAMTDVIFNGSNARKPVSQCSVELVFDNSSGRIGGEYANYNELSVKRVVTKDAVSSYLLNGAKCRRRDITDLFLGTGLGPRSYAIIEQGMISKLIESKPQELRVFIEEAAGISKYKERRKETLNRISHTKDNLDRLDDVRQAIGEQLAKLKRQAAAATRYKALKQEERTLKAQVASIRWLAQSALLSESDKRVSEFRQELESLVAGKQGDESGIQALKNDQSITKQQLSDVQQHIYQLGNDITKLEQSQLFAKKRAGQIDAEILSLHQQTKQVESAMREIDDELSVLDEQINQLAPEKDVLEEQLHELEDRHAALQDKQTQVLMTAKQTEDRFYRQKQDLQQKHGQLQQTLSLQERTEGRIEELKRELEEFAMIGGEDILRIQEQIEQLCKQQSAASELCNQLNVSVKTISDEVTQASEAVKSAESHCINLSAEQNALAALQQSDTQKPPSFLSGSEHKPAWQVFTVPSGYEKVLEAALSIYPNALVGANIDHAQMLSENEAPGVPIMLETRFSEQKRENTLATLVHNERLPHYFNQIIIAQNRDEATQMLIDLPPEWMVITRNGERFARDVYVSDALQADSKVLRKARLDALTDEISMATSALEEASEVHAELMNQLKAQQEQQVVAQTQLGALQSEKGLFERDLENLQKMQAQQAQRQQKVNEELVKQTQILEQEHMSLEMLSEEIEGLSIDLAEVEAEKLAAEADKQGIMIQLQGLQSQVQQAQQQLHKQVLLSQNLQNSHQILVQQKKNKQMQVSDYQEKELLLQDEAETLSMPSAQQQQKLQDMLTEKASLGERQQSLQHALDTIDEKLLDMEKGQLGINEKIDAIKQKIESERLSAQTAKVKAQTFVEQLSQMQQNIKEVLENLPEDAKEGDYQSQLDKTSADLGRLGAVNLAAVEEYEEQSVRKAHLDSQNEDLTQALETLENAMRKIDKETRTRFKETFDQVNDDLKTLFPKVFGGGSAYLALTDDDLLETGVTIMARPPGKKNSTIHLLSGGEKALTALSLVFAIFRLNPAPFCLLDEVDAPLDDANVGRFCKLVSEMSKTVQFIYITHNKVAMEMATHLTGVTMAEPGVSRMVSVDMEEALAIAE
jgi:chromosome segregation protein